MTIFHFTKWDFVYSRFKKDTTTSKMSEQDQPENTFSSSNGIMRNILYMYYLVIKLTCWIYVVSLNCQSQAETKLCCVYSNPTDPNLLPNYKVFIF